MIPSLGSHALRALTPQTAVNVDHSRCVRYRCNRNECSKRIDACQAGELDPVETDQQPPSFNSQLCVDFGSCESFCRNEGVRLTRKNQDAT